MIFLVPSSDGGSAQGHLKGMVIHTLPFGVASLASLLEREGRHVAIINDSITPVTPDLLRRAARGEQSRPVFGITSLTLQAQRAKELLVMIRETVPEAAVVVGGIHATAMPEEFIAAGFDFVFSGEADAVIRELADRLARGDDVAPVNGLIWKDATGEIRRNPPAPLMGLDDLPPFPYHLFQGDLAHYDVGAVMSSRGCPFKCIFCSQRAITGTRHRTRPVEHVLDEIGMLIEQYGIDFITFFDDNFVVNRSWTARVCEGLVSRGYSRRARFMCQMRGDAANPEVLAALREAGFEALSFGIETGSERMAKVINKGETVETIARAVRLAKASGFTTLGTFIVGFPTETAEDRDMTVRLAMSLPLDVLRINIAVPYPGTPLYDMVKDSLTISAGWKNFNVVSPLVTGPLRKLPLPYVPEGASEDELRCLMLWNNLRFWLRPKGITSFFFRKSTFVTRMPAGWYRDPGILWGVFNTAVVVLLNLLWVGFTGLKLKLGLQRGRSSG